MDNSGCPPSPEGPAFPTRPSQGFCAAPRLIVFLACLLPPHLASNTVINYSVYCIASCSAIEALKYVNAEEIRSPRGYRR